MSQNIPSRLIFMFTARKRSLRRLCFYRCLSVHKGGACVVARGGMHGCSGGGCVWLLPGGMHGCSGGACVVAPGGVRGSSGGGRAWFFPRDTVNERAVRILLECILVFHCGYSQDFLMVIS